MGMFIFVHLTPASCNWLCYGCHSNALSVALAAVILHSSAWLSSKTNKREKESVCCLHLLVLRDNWPRHGGQAAFVPLPPACHPPSPHPPLFPLRMQRRSTLSVREGGSSFHPSHVVCRISLFDPASAWRFQRRDGARVCLQSTECWTLTPPPSPPHRPSLSVIHCSCTKNESSYWESFCLHGGNTSRQISWAPTSLWNESLSLPKNKSGIDSTMGTNMVLCSVLFLALLLVAIFTHSHNWIWTSAYFIRGFFSSRHKVNLLHQPSSRGPNGVKINAWNNK